MQLVPASLIHVNPLARRLRYHDVRECEAMGRKPKQALRMSLATSLHALTALDEEGRPQAMFGVTPLSMLDGKGVPWFLGTDEVLRHARDLLTIGRRLIAHWHEDFRVMENVVSSENVAAIRLLKHWGADVGGEPATYGGLEFVPFRFERLADSALDAN